MRLLIVGPGRAGGSLALAVNAAGHDVVGLVCRRDLTQPGLPFPTYRMDQTLPETDLLVIATRDAAITDAARQLADRVKVAIGAVHVSGITPLAALHPLGERGVPIGSFHPLQSLPDPDTGSRALAGAWVAITAGGVLRDHLIDLATSLDMHPFNLADVDKPAYHAGAAAASNFVLAALDLAEALMTAAGVPLEAAAPLTATAVGNGFRVGPRQALTGPIAREDWATVGAQMAAAAAINRAAQFRHMAEATALTAGVTIPSWVTGADG